MPLVDGLKFVGASAYCDGMTASWADDRIGGGWPRTPPPAPSLSSAQWLADDPIEHAEQDTLGREPFARQVAKILDEAAGSSSSIVVGLTGPWGSGKSSTVNLTLDMLSLDTGQIRKVNPWGLSGADAVVAEVLVSIASGLPGRRAAKARKALGKYTAVASPLLSLIPTAGGIASGVADAAAARLSGDATLNEQADKRRTALLALKQPVLVVVDDVDRLQPAELMALFKAVRLLGRLPYVHYLRGARATTRRGVSGRPDAAGRGWRSRTPERAPLCRSRSRIPFPALGKRWSSNLGAG